MATKKSQENSDVAAKSEAEANAEASAEENVEASDAARDRAEKKGVDLAGVEGSGPDGQVEVHDVEHKSQEEGSGEKAMYAYVYLADGILDINTDSIRLSTKYGDRVFERDSKFLVPMEEYEDLATLRTRGSDAHPNGVQYVRKGGEL